MGGGVERSSVEGKENGKEPEKYLSPTHEVAP